MGFGTAFGKVTVSCSAAAWIPSASLSGRNVIAENGKSNILCSPKLDCQILQSFVGGNLFKDHIIAFSIP